MSNGVCSIGAVLFTAYFDKLFERLRASGIGCHIGKMYAGAFGYADDVVLLAPSLDALREMVSICETYATESGAKLDQIQWGLQRAIQDSTKGGLQ